MKPHHATVEPIDIDEDVLAELGETEPESESRKLPAPMGISALLDVEEPEEEFLVEGCVPASGNILLAGYPKTFKTMFILLLAVCLAAGVSFMGFPVPKRRRVGLVLMEDQAHRVRWRLKRLCSGLGISLEDLDGWLHIWFRPPLRLNDVTATELADYAGELDLDVLWVDSWAYVAAGDSNSSDEVTPQLQALSGARRKRPGLTVGLTHHARKDGGKKEQGTRLTDEIRNSGAFGAWYDAGLVLSRQGEDSPVTVRAELRDFAAPDSFAFTVEDEDPAGPHNNFRSGGWLQLKVSEHRPELVNRMAVVEKLVPAVRDLLAKHPGGLSRTKLRAGISARNSDIEAAFELLQEGGEAEHIPSEGKGKPALYRLLNTDPAQPCPDPAPGKVSGDPAHPAPPPEGGGQGQASRASGTEGGRGKVCSCGAPIGPTAEECATCKDGGES